MRALLVETLRTRAAETRLRGAVFKQDEGRAKIYYQGHSKKWVRARSVGHDLIKLEWFSECPCGG